jgi:thymidine kinase
MCDNYAYLELIIGPMFSGKTSRLVEEYNKCKFCEIPVMVINHSFDNRYDNELLSTHDKIKIPCIKLTKLEDIWKEKIRDVKVVLINEGQFFEDLYDTVNLLLKHKKKVYVCGLDGDFERNKFGKILDLIPMCDKVTKLTSLCSLCKNGSRGIFSMRITEEKEQTVVGFNNYIPVCRNCYDKKIQTSNNITQNF